VRAQQQSGILRTAGFGPAPRAIAVFGVLPDPADIGLQRIDQPVQAVLELRLVVEKNEIEARQRFRHQFGIDGAADDRREALVQRRGVGDFALADLRSDRIRAEREHDRIGLRDQRLQASPPVLEGVDLLAVDHHRKAARDQRRFEAIDEGHVAARIGDEYPGLRLALGCCRCGPCVARHRSTNPAARPSAHPPNGGLNFWWR
jgi:hypothetical protein